MDSRASGFQVSFGKKMRIVRLVHPIFVLLLVTALVSGNLVHAQSGKLEIIKAVYGKEGLEVACCFRYSWQPGSRMPELVGGRGRDRTGDPLLAKHETLLQQFHWNL
jgi:hypothetical protein